MVYVYSDIGCSDPCWCWAFVQDYRVEVRSLNVTLILLTNTVLSSLHSAFVGLAIIIISIPVPAYISKKILSMQEGKMDVVSYCLLSSLYFILS